MGTSLMMGANFKVNLFEFSTQNQYLSSSIVQNVSTYLNRILSEAHIAKHNYGTAFD